jgi:hypothetical protein
MTDTDQAAATADDDALKEAEAVLRPHLTTGAVFGITASHDFKPYTRPWDIVVSIAAAITRLRAELAAAVQRADASINAELRTHELLTQERERLAAERAARDAARNHAVETRKREHETESKLVAEQLKSAKHEAATIAAEQRAEAAERTAFLVPGLQTENGLLHDALAAEREARERMREALEFYADPFTWKKLHDPENDVQIPDFYSECCFGETAQAALAAPAEASTGEAERNRQADEAMREIWSRWFTFYSNHFRGGGIAISAADQMAFEEIAQPILRGLVSPARPAQKDSET